MNTEVRILEPGQIELPAGHIHFLSTPGKIFLLAALSVSDFFPRVILLEITWLFWHFFQTRSKRFWINSPLCLCLIPMNRRYAVRMACRCWAPSPGPETRHGVWG